MTEIWNLSTLCRCCHSDGCFKSLNESYTSSNGVEIYEILLHETLGIRISQPQIEASYTICNICISRLKDAVQFKEQILTCEKKFQVYCTNEQFLGVNIIDNVKSESNSHNSDNESTDTYVQDEEIAIEVDFNYAIEDTKENIKLNECINEEKNKHEQVDIKSQEDKGGKVKKSPSKRPVKQELQKKIKRGKEREKDKKSKSHKKSIDGAKKWQIQKLRLKLVHSYIVQIKTKTGMKYSCKNCEGSYEEKKEILKHIRLQHVARCKCEQCGKPFLHEYKLRRHMKTVHSNELYACSYCKKTFTCKSNLKVHENCHTKKDIYECDSCNKKFYYRGTLRKHITQKHTPNVIYNKFICDVCGLSCYDRTNLEIHIRTVHLKQRPYACNICGKTYTARKHVKYHMKIHSDNPKPFQCNECPKTYACIKGLTYHKENHHLDGKDFTCKYCSIVFNNKRNHDLHLRCHAQSLSDPLTCQICGKTLMTKFTLNRHIDVHNGIKRYGCEVCGLRFTQKTLLERHRIRKHDPSTKIEKVKCLHCKKMVRNMERHMATHDDEKRFFCDICGKSYAENNTLTRHKKHAHFGVSYDCVYCGKKYINKRSLANHENKLHKVKRETVESTDVNKDEDLESK